jgi:sugar/nucleoside kinase (ribokinase family)
MQNKTDVIVVGELNVDLILNQIDGFPEIGKEKLAGSMTLTLGSSSAIFASNLSSLGSTVAFLGKIGADAFAELVVQSLQTSNVKTDLIISDPNLKTGATIVLNYDEDRAMITHGGAMEALTIDDISDEKLKQARHLHFSSYFLQPGLRAHVGRMFQKAKSLGLSTSFDAQWDPEEKWELDLPAILPYVDVFLPNRQELCHLTGRDDVDEALDSVSGYANTVAVKMGNQGSLLWHKGKKNKQKAFLNNQVVDAIGAGDSFNAGFIHRFIQGHSLEDCQSFGNLSGAMSTTAAGGTAAFRDYTLFCRVARERFGYQV